MSDIKTELTNLVQHVFLNYFGYPCEKMMQAPGRVNLIGEHTDYNDGFVLPCAINFHVIVAAAARSDTIVRVIAADYQNQVDQFDLSEDILPHHYLPWANYIRGVVKILLSRGKILRGMDIVVAGNIPQGAGLSSSAALEVAIIQSFAFVFKLNIGRKEIAAIGQQAENEFVGCQCGIMDQLASIEGMRGHALLIDCRSLEIRTIKIPANTQILIINSHVRRDLVVSEYNLRRQQCRDAARLINVKALRDVSATDLDGSLLQLPEQVAQRARHVVSENQRTLDAAKALESRDLAKVQALMAESHLSMRHDFEITVPEVDQIVDIVSESLGGLGGARMTGGGFGGCVVCLVQSELVSQICQAVQKLYRQKTNGVASIYRCAASNGAGEVPFA
jgi:galactokinase